MHYDRAQKPGMLTIGARKQVVEGYSGGVYPCVLSYAHGYIHPVVHMYNIQSSCHSK